MNHTQPEQPQTCTRCPATQNLIRSGRFNRGCHLHGYEFPICQDCLSAIPDSLSDCYDCIRIGNQQPSGRSGGRPY